MTGEIGVFCPTLNVYGGGEYVAIATANALAQNKHNVVLFTSKPVNPMEIKNYFGETLHPSIQTVIQPTNFTPRGLGDFYQTIINSYVAKKKCQVFVDAFSNCVYQWTQISYIHFPYLNQFSFAKNFPYLRKPRLSQAATLPHVVLEKNLIDYEKRLVLANSHYTADEIKRYSGKTADVLYPPFASNIAEIGKETKKNPQDNLVVTVSRLDSNKLLERVPLIAAKTGRNVQFAVIGRLCSQPTLDYLQALTKKLGVSDRLKFYPNASAQQKTELLKKAKIYLHTMIGEHFGISIVEAMALGCVPIVHDSGGMREFVPSQYRYLTVEQATEKISFGISAWSPEEAESMKAIAARFSYENFSKRFLSLFESEYGDA